MYRIDTDFEGANLKVLSASRNEAKIDVELRDTVGDWFFWCFRVRGAAGKTIKFKFPNNARVGYFGAAVSYDLKNWHWQYEDSGHNGSEFEYSFAEDEDEVYFAHDMVYRPERFFRFANGHGFEIKEWCKSEKGRSVPYIEFGEGKETILLTARHHACESTGNYVLEGVLKALKNNLSDKFRVICVPFVDYDGVMDGDQGKNRNNHDHNRDYIESESPRYASVARIRELAECEKVRFAFDFHSPWHLGGANDTVFIPIKHYGDALKRITRFSNIFEEASADSGFPHFAYDNFLPDVDWNKYGAPCFGTFWGRRGAELSFTLETAYFTASGIRFDTEKAVETGENFVNALTKYTERGERIAVIGDILYQIPMNDLCKTEDGYDFRQTIIHTFPDILNCDFLTGNPETPYAGEALEYTKERWAFNSPDEALGALAKNGVDLLTFANNHCLDRGVEGLYATCENCERAGVNYIGISKAKRNAVYIKDFGGRKIAFVNATYGTNAFCNHVFLEGDDKFEKVALTQPQETLEGSVNLLSSLDTIAKNTGKLYAPDSELAEPYLKYIKRDIEYAKANSDYVIMLLHSGGQYNMAPDAYTTLLCDRIRAYGADMIIANHPHIILPSLLDGDFFCAYSIGNFQTAVYRSDVMPKGVMPEYSAAVYLDFEDGEQEPHISFSIMNVVFDKDGKSAPRTHNSFELYKKAPSEELKAEILHFANLFMPGNDYKEIERNYKIR